MKKSRYRYSSLGIAFIGMLIVSGCGSSDDSKNTGTQTINFSEYTMELSDKFMPLSSAVANSDGLANSPLYAYSVPTPSDDFFEKNIIISEDSLNNLSLQHYVQESLSAIRSTRGGYDKFKSSSQTITCGQETIPAIQHTFQITRDALGQTGQIVYFAQYYFANHDKITILSASSDVSDDRESFLNYFHTISCATDSPDDDEA